MGARPLAPWPRPRLHRTLHLGRRSFRSIRPVRFSLSQTVSTGAAKSRATIRSAAESITVSSEKETGRSPPSIPLDPPTLSATASTYHETNGNYGFIRDALGNFTTLDASVGGSGFGTYPVAINDNGEVVGSSRDQFNNSHSFLRDHNGNVTTFDPPGFADTWAVGISSTGEIVGYGLEGVFSGYVRDQSGAITTFRAPGDQYGTTPTSINGSGQVTGYYYDGKSVSHGFVRDPAGNSTTFDAPGGGTQNSQGTIAASINDDGEITGYVISSRNIATGFLRGPSGTITLFRVPTAGKTRGQGTFSVSINHGGSVTGAYVDSSGIYHGFFGYLPAQQ